MQGRMAGVWNCLITQKVVVVAAVVVLEDVVGEVMDVMNVVNLVTLPESVVCELVLVEWEVEGAEVLAHLDTVGALAMDEGIYYFN